MTISPEPIGEWQRIGTHNILQAYYQHPQRWAYSFQTYALLSRMNQLFRMMRAPSTGLLFTERSIAADRAIFARLLQREGHLSAMEYEMYLHVFDDLGRLADLQLVHRPIYLRTAPEVCLQRMQKRARKEETGVGIDYLTKIHELHEEWLGQSFTVEGTLDFEHDEKQLAEMAGKIRKWIES
jgi:deoxyadenosine/deoxycytidine kinase